MILLSWRWFELTRTRTIVSTQVIARVIGSNHLLNVLLLQFVLGRFDVFSLSMVTSTLIPRIVITQWDIYSLNVWWWLLWQHHGMLSGMLPHQCILSTVHSCSQYILYIFILHAYIWTYIQTCYMYMCTCINTHVSTYNYVCTHVHTCLVVYKQTYVHTYICKYVEDWSNEAVTWVYRHAYVHMTCQPEECKGRTTLCRCLRHLLLYEFFVYEIIIPSSPPSFGYSITSSFSPSFGYSMTPSSSPSFGYSNNPSPLPSFGHLISPSPPPSFGYSITPSSSPSFGYSMTPSFPPSFGYSMTPSPSPSFGWSFTPSPPSLHSLAAGTSNTCTPTSVQWRNYHSLRR